MAYYKLNMATMPPVDNRRYFILWRNAGEPDDMHPALAKRVQYQDTPYIRYVTCTGWQMLPHGDYKSCLWTELEPPSRKEQRMIWEG